MKHPLVHLLRLVIVCLMILTTWVNPSPALAHPHPTLLGQTGYTTSLGSAKDLLGQEGVPIFKSIDHTDSPYTADQERFKRVADSINKSLDRTKNFEQRGDRLQVDLKLPQKNTRKSEKPKFPVSDR